MTAEDRGATLIVLWAVALTALVLVLGAEWWVGR